ncbi:sigma factor [Streptomyces sp. NPDC006872]|uniref:sigma factor n=1 Tax=Streptomyces sp. NPDC006872 TaxID=3155720 RepID=UPI0033FB82A4
MTGSEVLVRALYAEHGKALLAYATRLAGDRAVGEDIVQETLVRAWRHLVADPAPVLMRTWLFTIARNIATDRSLAQPLSPHAVAEPDSTAVVHQLASGRR